MNVCFNGGGSKGREMCVVVENLGVSDDGKLWVVDVEPVWNLTIRDEVDVSNPRSMGVPRTH